MGNVRCHEIGINLVEILLLIRKSLAITALKPLVSKFIYRRRKQTHPRRGRGDRLPGTLVLTPPGRSPALLRRLTTALALL
jgi:hypothetical protein